MTTHKSTTDATPTCREYDCDGWYVPRFSSRVLVNCLSCNADLKRPARKSREAVSA